MVNVLHIISDDMFQYRDFVKASGRFGVAPFGVELTTPNLDRLAARSTNFLRAACIVPVCMPSRAAVMSGFSPAETGIFGDSPFLNERVQPEQQWLYALRQAGYHMETHGKVYHMGAGYQAPPQIYFDRLYDNPKWSYQMTPNTAPDNTYDGVDGGGAGWIGQDADFFDYQVAQSAIDFINVAGRGDWYFECGFKAPHEPFEWPQRCFDAIPLESIIQPVDWPLSWDLLPFTANEMRDQQLLNIGHSEFSPSPSTWTTAEITKWKNSVRNFLAGILWFDEQLGRVLDALDASEYASNTMIVFWSDHGYHLGDKGKFHKFDLWEEACNSMLMVSTPGQTTTLDVSESVSLMDIGPTILDYLGLPIREGFRGISLRPYIEQTTPPANRMVPTFWPGSISGGRGMERVTAYQDGTYEYYDLSADPWCANNLALAGGPAFEAIREQLHAVAKDWGFLIVEEGAAILPGSPMATIMGYSPEVNGKITSDFYVLGDLDARADSPNYKRMYKISKYGPAQDIHMPEGVGHFESFNTAQDLTIYGNGADNTIIMKRQANSVSVIVHAGDGDDFIQGGRNIVIHGGRGNDIARGPGGTFYGGEGDDTLENTRTNPWTVYGGPGNDTISTGGGNDTIYADAGSDVINAGPGTDLVIVTGGSHLITLGGGADTIEIRRTGQVQTITDVASGDTLDLSDWSAIQPVSVVQDGADVIVSAALEKIICQNIDAATVSGAITGATVA